jgi:hypothetical protein
VSSTVTAAAKAYSSPAYGRSGLASMWFGLTRKISSPNDTTFPYEEVALTASDPPDGRVKARRTISADGCRPGRVVFCDETQLYDLSAAAGAFKRS